MGKQPPLRVMVLMGTRPEAIKLAPVVLALRAKPTRFASSVCVTGQHREIIDSVVEEFGLAPDYNLDVMSPGQGLAELSGRVLQSVSEVFRSARPDVLLVQGDTTSVAMGALAAFYERIPVGHVEAGLRTGDRYDPFPEEINRRLVSKLATWHYAPTATAKAALVREGIEPASIHLTGNTVVDALLQIASQIPEPPAGPEKMLLVTAHRRESFGRAFDSICYALRDLVRRNPDVRVVYPVHPNPNVREPVQRILGGEDRVDLLDPVGYREMVTLMKAAYLILTDSGGIQEEAPALGKPVLVLRQVTERPEAVAAGVVKVVGTDRRRIVRETELLLQDEAEYARMATAVSPYGDGHAAERISAHLETVARSRPAIELPASVSVRKVTPARPAVRG